MIDKRWFTLNVTIECARGSFYFLEFFLREINFTILIIN